MSDLKVGDRVEYRGEGVSVPVGSEGDVVRLRNDEFASVAFDFGETFILRRDDLRRSTTPREVAMCRLAATRLREAEAVVAQRRAELRAAWVAAIAALPPVADAGTFDDVVAVLREYLGPVAPFRANPHQEAAWWDWSGKARVGLRRDEEHLYLRVDAPDASLRTLCHLTGPEAVTTDAAVRRALTWLAERDVFLLDR